MADLPMHQGAHEGDRDYLPTTDSDTPSTGPLDDIKSGLKLWADLGVSIGKSLDEVAKTNKKLLARLQRNTPIDYSCIASAVCPAAGFCVLNFGSPDQGTFWHVESCAVGGLDEFTAAAGTAGLYVSGFVPQSGTTQSPGMTSLADQATTLPNIGFYGGRDVVVNDQEYLFLLIFNGTSAQQYAANAQVTVYNVTAGKGGEEITV
jgi:hypothetical protein